MSRWAGVSRRASANAYSKSASAKTSDALGPMKLRTPTVKAPKAPKNAPGAKASAPVAGEISFGTTGYSQEDWYGPLR
jgi:hypothetical protein